MLHKLKQCPQIQNKNFVLLFKKEDLDWITKDTCVFVKNDFKGLVITWLYVDYGLKDGANKKIVNKFILMLKSVFGVKFNDPKCFVSLDVTQNIGVISINQGGCTGKVVKNLGYWMQKQFWHQWRKRILLADTFSKSTGDVSYTEALGCLNFISQVSCMNIT